MHLRLTEVRCRAIRMANEKVKELGIKCNCGWNNGDHAPECNLNSSWEAWYHTFYDELLEYSHDDDKGDYDERRC